MSEQNEIIAQLFDWVKNAGAKADVIISTSESLSLKANQGELEEHKVTDSQILGVRVIKNNRVGIAYSESTDEDALRFMVDEGLNNLQYSDERPEEQISSSTATLMSNDTLLCPTDNATIEDKIAFTLSLESELTKKPLIKNVPYNGLIDETSSQQLYSTEGFYGRQTHRGVTAYACALAASGELVSMGPGASKVRSFDQLGLQSIIDEAYESSIALLEGKPIETGHYDVIFNLDSQNGIFSAFQMVWSGKAAKDGISPWRDKVSTSVADNALTLVDIPRDTNGLCYSLFDAEGTPTAETKIINQGKLETFLHNSATANHFGVSSTGHGARSAKSMLDVSAHQLAILPGKTSAADITAGSYLEITDLTGMHSGANAISGEFSLGVSGFLCRDGKRLQPVREVTVAGNFYKMLNDISAIGDNANWNRYGSTHMPTIRFHKLAISG